MASIQEQVYEIIQRKLSVNAEQITPEASFTEDLGADSLDTVELVMDLEEQFNITIPEEDQEKLRTVQDAIEYSAQSPWPSPADLVSRVFRNPLAVGKGGDTNA